MNPPMEEAEEQLPRVEIIIWAIKSTAWQSFNRASDP